MLSYDGEGGLPQPDDIRRGEERIGGEASREQLQHIADAGWLEQRHRLSPYERRGDHTLGGLSSHYHLLELVGAVPELESKGVLLRCDLYPSLAGLIPYVGRADHVLPRQHSPEC